MPTAVHVRTRKAISGDIGMRPPTPPGRTCAAHTDDANPMLSVVPDEATEVSDAELIQASLVDGERFAAIYDRHVTRLYRYACRRLGADSAEDAVADAFSVAFGARIRYDPARSDAGPWLFGILSKEISRRRRTELIRYRALRRTGPDRPVDGPEQRVADGVTAAAQRGRLARALADLAAGDRDVLLLVAWGDLSYQEVADALHIPIGTVRSRLNRARRTVRTALGGDDPTRDTDDA